MESILGALAVRLLTGVIRSAVAFDDFDVGVADGGGVGALSVVAALDEGCHFDGRRLHSRTHHGSEPEGAAEYNPRVQQTSRVDLFSIQIL